MLKRNKMKKELSVYRWNNFYLYFPNGMYRNYQDKERKKKIISDLDKIIKEKNFDLKKFNEIIRKKDEYFETYMPILKKKYQQNQKLTEEEKKKLEELKNLERENYKQLDSLLEPIINEMIKLGYNLEDLIR